MKNILYKWLVVILMTALGSSNLMAQQTFPTTFTLPSGKTIVITYEVTVNANACSPTPPTKLTAQGTVSGSNFTSVLTDDPNVAGTNNPTEVAFNDPVITGSSISSTAVCFGGTINLQATCPVSTTVKWYTVSSGGSEVATGTPYNPSNIIQNTSYYASCQSADCESSRTLVGSVTVQSLPTPGINVPSGTICTGTAISLTGTGGASYSWGASSGSFSSTTGSPTGWVLNAGGTYSVTVTAATTASCTATATASVSANVSPPVQISASASSICAGFSVNLTATGASTYSWSSTGGSFTSTTNSSTSWSAAIANQYNITVTGNDGTCTNSMSTTVSVNSLPVANISVSSAVVCVGNSISLTGTSGSAYTWGASGGSFTSTNASVSSWNGAAGAYTINLTVDNGTCTNSTNTTVSVNTVPTASISIPNGAICVGATINLTGTGGSNYSWASSSGGSFTSTTGSPASWSASSGGVYSITVTAANGSCTNMYSTTLSANSLPSIGINKSASAVCLGNSINLTGTGGSSYSWSGSSGSFNSTTGSPVTWSGSAGSYTITLTGSDGTCTNTNSTTVSTHPLPTTSISVSSPAVCEGNSIGLTASGGGLYTWGASGGNFTSTTASNTSWSGAAGGYTINLTVNNGTCINSTNTTVSVNVVPTPGISGASGTVCVGATINLTGTGGNTYSWNFSGGNFTSTTGSPVGWSASTGGSYTFSVTVANGTCTASTLSSISVNNLPSISINPQNGQVCAGSNITLSATSGLSSYSWQHSGGNFTSTLSNATFSSNVADGFSFTITAGNGICTNTSTASVTVNALPSITISPTTSQVCLGQTLNLTATAGLNSYSWASSGGIFTSTTNQATFSSNSAGGYSFTVTASNGTCTNTATASVTVNAGPNISTHPASQTLPELANLVLTVVATNATSYQWQKDNANFGSSSASPSLNLGPATFGMSGTYKVYR